MSFQRRFALTCVVAFLLTFAPQSQAAVYDLTITVDNAYAFGFGNQVGIAAGNLSPMVVNTTAGDIFNTSGPETYPSVNSASYSYVYIAAWADDATANGALASFISNGALQFSTGVWEVFATGDKTSTAAQALTAASINLQIGKANLDMGDPGGSIGWVRSGIPPSPRVGSIIEDVGGALYKSAVPLGSFLPGFLALFDTSAGWLWYDNGATNPFDYTAAGDGGWLIFRAGIPLLCDASASGLWDTGVDASGNVLTDGTLDTHYTLQSGPAPVNPNDPSYKSGQNPGVWLANDAAGSPGSAWIGRRPVSSIEFNGAYTYRINVSAPNNSPLPTVTGRWSSDNNGLDILVNNGSTGQTQTVGFGQWQNFSIPGVNWISGTNNTVDFVVQNSATFHGLRVEWCVSPPGVAPPPPPPGPSPNTMGVPTLDLAGYLALITLTVGSAIFILRRW